MRNKWLIWISLVVAASLALASCAAQPATESAKPAEPAKASPDSLTITRP